MQGYTFGRFVVTLGLGVTVWFASGFIQALAGFADHFRGYYGCSLTGYPIALCLPAESGVEVVAVSFLNIVVWVVFVHLMWNAMKSQK